ncbi:MAG: hypothetical protein WCA63_11755 [Gallionella sp.]
MLTSWSDGDIGAILGIDRDADFAEAEREHPDLMLIVTTQPSGSAHSPFTPRALVRAARGGRWQGQANTLSAHHLFDWPVIDEAAHACTKPETQDTPWQASMLPEPLNSICNHPASHVATFAATKQPVVTHSPRQKAELHLSLL